MVEEVALVDRSEVVVEVDLDRVALTGEGSSFIGGAGSVSCVRTAIIYLAVVKILLCRYNELERNYNTIEKELEYFSTFAFAVSTPILISSPFKPAN